MYNSSRSFYSSGESMAAETEVAHTSGAYSYDAGRSGELVNEHGSCMSVFNSPRSYLLSVEMIGAIRRDHGCNLPTSYVQDVEIICTAR